MKLSDLLRVDADRYREWKILLTKPLEQYHKSDNYPINADTWLISQLLLEDDQLILDKGIREYFSNGDIELSVGCQIFIDYWKEVPEEYKEQYDLENPDSDEEYL